MSVPAEKVTQMSFDSKTTDKPVHLKNGEAKFKGRITGYRRINTQNGPMHLTLVTIPAPDEYSSPQTIEVRSRLGKLGEREDEVTFIGKIGGYRRQYKSADESTGEMKTIHSANLTIDVVES